MITFKNAVFAFILIGAFSGVPTLVSSDSVTLADFMTEQEKKDTGLSKLNKSELENLTTWVATNFIYSPLSSVNIIAPSLSTAAKAKKIRIAQKLVEFPPRTARQILVVVRSSLNDPLWKQKYDSYAELKKDAEGQLNISGPKYHIYVYVLNDDLTCSRVSHTIEEVKN